MSDSNENTSSSREKSSESEGNAYSTDSERHRWSSEELRDLEVAHPNFQAGCRAHDLHYLAEIPEEEYNQFRAKFALNTDNWDDPGNVDPETVTALHKDWRRGTVPVDGTTAPAIANRKTEMESWMIECEEALSRDDRTLTASQEILLQWIGAWLVRSGKIYANEGSFERYMTLAEALLERQKHNGDVPHQPATDGFRWFESWGYYLKVWDLRLEELSQPERQ